MSITLFETSHFRSEYDSKFLFDVSRDKVIEAVRTFVIRYHQDPASIAKNRGYGRDYDWVSGFPGNATIGKTELLEIRISNQGNAPRLIAWWKKPELTLLAVGDHSTTTKWKYYARSDSVVNRGPLQDPFDVLYESSLYSPRSIIGKRDYPEEYTYQWVYFLSETQQNVVRGLMKECTRGTKGTQVRLVLGGSGTGKTIVLLKLLERLIVENIDVQIHISEDICDYLNIAPLGFDVRDYRCDQWDDYSSRVLLVDDPDSKKNIYEIIEAAEDNGVKVVIFAFDPRQLFDIDALSDKQVTEICRKYGPSEPIWLDQCYRQREEVGRAYLESARVITDVCTAYLAENKISGERNNRAVLTERSNIVTFPLDGGHAPIRDEMDSTATELRREVNRIRSRYRWSYWYDTLVIVDNVCEVAFPKAWQSALDDLGQGYGGARYVDIDDLQSQRGLEYNNAILLLRPTTYHRILHGERGMTQAGYLNHAKNMIIGLSRSKESMAVFVKSCGCLACKEAVQRLRWQKEVDTAED